MMLGWSAFAVAEFGLKDSDRAFAVASFGDQDAAREFRGPMFVPDMKTKRELQINANEMAVVLFVILFSCGEGFVDDA